MNKYPQTYRDPTTRKHGMRLLIASILFLFAAVLVGCNDDSGCSDGNCNDGTNATTGALNLNVTPASTTVVVTGPGNFTQTFTGNQFLPNLAPGVYTADASAPEFYGTTGQINVVAGETSSISLALLPTQIISEAPHAVYRDDAGNLIPIDANAMDSGQFVFYAWLEDKPSGIIPAKLTGTSATNPGAPLLIEQQEIAPSFTQNVAGAWVGFKDEKGIVRPVIGADVRWEIDQWWTDRVNSMQFGTSDDNKVASDYGVYDDWAYTRTNNARLDVERYPFAMSEYPLYNATGVNSPFVDGFTWVTLFSPDAKASGRVVAVATINGEEIGKQILEKNFAPSPKLEITKTVDKDIVNMVNGSASVTWTVTVKNVGSGDAAKVDLKDFLASGVGANYTIGSLPAGSTLVGDGFTLSFPLLAGGTKTLTFTGTVSEPGAYCNEAQILDLKAQACFTALESNLSIIKDFVTDDETTSLGKSWTLAANQAAKLRVRVTNQGNGTATGVKVNDVLTSGDATKYELISEPAGSTRNTSDGFDITIGNLAAGATKTLFFTVKASSDGVYCDTATVTATSGSIGINKDSACLTVATPNLTITKVNAPKSVLPGATYTSTIVVKNTGSAPAKNVVISDTMGLNSASNVRAIYVSSSLNGVGGLLAANKVTANKLDILANGTITFSVVSRIPPGAVAGTYCDTATFTSDNAGTKQATDCVDVPAFSALQTQLTDLNDPITVGSEVSFFSVLYVEKLSNEGVGQNKLTYSFGLVSPTVLGIPGVFDEVSTAVYVDTKPVRDPVTGLVVSDMANPSAERQIEGSDYTLANQLGKQVITMTPGVVLQPDTAIYVMHVVKVPSTTATSKMYTTSYIWDAVGLINSANAYKASSSEPTTVLP
jgi:uncharacterized repeat protein (TIGR01451 family)